MKTKQDLLCKMKVLGACKGAREYVSGQPDSSSAEEIWHGCTREDWLCWFAFRCVSAHDFVFSTADRAVREYAPRALEAAGLSEQAQTLRALAPVASAETAYAAAHGAYATAAYASRAAAYAARAADDAAAYAAARASAYAAYAAAYAVAYAAERKVQMDQLHALWPQIVETWGTCGGKNG